MSNTIELVEEINDAVIARELSIIDENWKKGIVNLHSVYIRLY